MKKTVFLIALFYSSYTIFAQTQIPSNPFPKTITVTGSAEMEIIPDEIYVNITLHEYQKKGESRKDLETLRTEFLETCHAVGIPDSLISIAGYAGSSNYYWLRRKGKKTQDLFSSITYQIKFRNGTMMDNLIDKLDDDATQSFTIVSTSHSKMVEFRKQLKIQAVRAAKEKAIYLSEAIGEKIGSAVTIAEPQEETIYPLMNNFSKSNTYLGLDNMKESSIQEVDFKKLKLKFEVNVTFALQ